MKKYFQQIKKKKKSSFFDQSSPVQPNPEKKNLKKSQTRFRIQGGYPEPDERTDEWTVKILLSNMGCINSVPYVEICPPWLLRAECLPPLPCDLYIQKLLTNFLPTALRPHSFMTSWHIGEPLDSEVARYSQECHKYDESWKLNIWIFQAFLLHTWQQPLETKSF